MKRVTWWCQRIKQTFGSLKKSELPVLVMRRYEFLITWRLTFNKTVAECRKMCSDGSKRMVTYKDLVSEIHFLRPPLTKRFWLIEIFFSLIMILRNSVTWVKENRKQREKWKKKIIGMSLLIHWQSTGGKTALFSFTVNVFTRITSLIDVLYDFGRKQWVDGVDQGC